MATIVNKLGEGATNASPTNSGRSGAVDPMQLFSVFNDKNCWTTEAREFINHIRTTLADKSRSLVISSKFVGNNAIAFLAGDKALVLMINSMDVQTPQDILNETQYSAVIIGFNEEYPDHELLNAVIVNKDMFGRVDNMLNYIDDMLTSANMPVVNELTIDSFDKRTSPYRLDIDRNTANMREFMDSRSPMATNVRDFGFVCRLVKPGKPNQQPTSTPIFGVSAYIEFIFDQVNSSPGMDIFTPVVHISEIITTMYSSKVLAFVLPIAAEELIGKALWKRQFSAESDLPFNLGNLFGVDEAGKLIQAESDVHIATIMDQHLTKTSTGTIAAHLVIDYTVGAPNIPGLDQIASPESQQYLIDAFGRFFSGDDYKQNGKFAIAKNIAQEVTGSVETDNKITGAAITDLRQMTYLYLCGSYPYNERFIQLLQRYPDPVARFDTYRNILKTVTPTYKVVHVELDGAACEVMASLVDKTCNIVVPIDDRPPSLVLGNTGVYGGSAFNSNTGGFGHINTTRFGN